MSNRITKSQRWLDLIAYLVARRLPVAVDELMEHIPSYATKWSTGDDGDRAAVRRMFERDKDELRALGIPIETVAYSIHGAPGEDAQGYRLARRDFYLPYLRVLSDVEGTGTGAGTRDVRGRGGDPRRIQEVEVEEGDLADAVRGLAEVSELPGFPYAAEARSALRKLTFDVDAAGIGAGGVDHAAPGAGPVFFPVDADAGERRARIEALADALFARKTAAFLYRGIQRDEATEREVHPYGLLFQHGHWYLIAYDPMRDDMRVFRVDRMENVTRNTRRPGTPDYEIPRDFSLGDYAHREAWELGPADAEPVRARVRFAFPRSLWAQRNDHGELVAESDDGSAVRAFEVTQPDPFLRWLLSMGGEATVESPAEMSDELRSMAGRIAALHQGVSGGTA